MFPYLPSFLHISPLTLPELTVLFFVLVHPSGPSSLLFKNSFSLVDSVYIGFPVHFIFLTFIKWSDYRTSNNHVCLTTSSGLTTFFLGLTYQSSDSLSVPLLCDPWCTENFRTDPSPTSLSWDRRVYELQFLSIGILPSLKSINLRVFFIRYLYFSYSCRSLSYF